MKFRWLTLIVLFAFAMTPMGCDKIKELTGQGEKDGTTEEKKADEPKTSDEVAQAIAEAEKAKAEAETAKAEAEAEKAKVEQAQKRVAEAEADKAKAEEDRMKSEEQHELDNQKKAREGLTKDLQELTTRIATTKTGLNSAYAAWKSRDEGKALEIKGLLDEIQKLDEETSLVEQLMTQNKFDEAGTKVASIQGKLGPVETKSASLMKDRPVDEGKWNATISILAEETCLQKKNLPVQDFQKEYQGLFAKYGIEREEYEQLRAKFNKSASPDDRMLLMKTVKEKCTEQMEAKTEEVVAPAEDDTATEEKADTEVAPADTEGKSDGEAVEEGTDTEEAEAVEEEPKEEVSVDGTYQAFVKVKGKKGSLKLHLKNKGVSGRAALPGSKPINVKGSYTGSKHVKFSGSATRGKIACTGTLGDGHIKGSCSGRVSGTATSFSFNATKK